MMTPLTSLAAEKTAAALAKYCRHDPTADIASALHLIIAAAEVCAISPALAADEFGRAQLEIELALLRLEDAGLSHLGEEFGPFVVCWASNQLRGRMQ